MAIQWILSDFFGVTVDEAAPAFFKNVLHIEDPSSLCEKYFVPGDEGKFTMDEVIEHVTKDFNIPYESMHDYLFNKPQEHTKYTSFLRQLKKQGYSVALLSDAPGGIVESIFAKYHLEEIFNPCFISYKTHLTKPHKETFENVFASLKAKPEEILFIDDNPKNIKAAKELGINAIHYVSEEETIKEATELLTKEKK